MRKSLLVQIYLNMAAAYTHLNHFALAERVLQDALEISDKVSQVYLRRAQAALCNKSSSVEQLQRALEDI
jgi:Tfp pilus assembly protein PilF